MKNSWRVKYSGKLDILLFSYLVMFCIYLSYVIRGTIIEGGDIINNFFMGLLFLFLHVIAILSIPYSMLKRKVIPKTIDIDLPSNTMNITYFKKSGPSQVYLNDLAYDTIENTFFTVLVLYEKSIATRGHILHFELMSIIALNISTSWKKRQVKEIAYRLNELQVLRHTPANQKSLADYLLE